MPDKEISENGKEADNRTLERSEQRKQQGLESYSLVHGLLGVFGILLFLTSLLTTFDGDYTAATAFAVMACYAHLASTRPFRSIW